MSDPTPGSFTAGVSIVQYASAPGIFIPALVEAVGDGSPPVLSLFVGPAQYHVDGVAFANDGTVGTYKYDVATSFPGDLTVGGNLLVDGTSELTGNAAADAAFTVGGASTSGTNTGDVTLAAVGSSPSANGASLTAQALTLQPADGTHPGLVTSGTQTIGGAKTFSGGVKTDTLLSATNADPGILVTTTLSGTATGFKFNAINSPSVLFNIASAGTPFFQVSNSAVTTLQEGRLNSNTADGASAVPWYSDTSSAMTGANALLWSFRNNTTQKAYISKNGSFGGTYTDTSGTPGSGTANTVTGRSAIAATSSAAITITNALCTATSVVMATLEDNDAVCKSLAVVPGSGSFTVTPGATTTAITKFRWILFDGV